MIFQQCIELGLPLNFSELRKMSVFSKDMKRIGKIADVDFDLEDRLIKGVVVKVDGGEAKRVWKGKLSLRSPRVIVPIEFVATAKDAIQLQYPLGELKDIIKKI
jgi:sporulation protein YlmC with PRC-barrel domain